MFKVKVGGTSVPILELDILHREEQLPVVVFTVPKGTYNDILGKAIELTYADTIITQGIAQSCKYKIQAHKAKYQLTVKYTTPSKVERQVDEYYDPVIINQDHERQSAVARFKLLNHSLLSGAFVESAIIPTKYTEISCECYEQRATQKSVRIKAARIEIDAKWTYENCGYFDLGVLIADTVNQSLEAYRAGDGDFRRVNYDYSTYDGVAYNTRRSFPSHIPFELAGYIDSINRSLENYMWIARHNLSFLDLFCYKHTAGDGALISGMHACLDLLLGWQIHLPVEERVLIDMRNPLYKEIGPDEVQYFKFHVAPSVSEYPLWKSGAKYSIGDTVSLGSKVYQCTTDHQDESFDDPAWRADAKWEIITDAHDRENCYFTTDRGRCTLSYACNIAAGHLLRHSRTSVMRYKLPTKYITQLHVGDGVRIVTTDNAPSSFTGVIAMCHLISSAKKSYLEIDVVSPNCVINSAIADEGIATNANGLRIKMPDVEVENRFFLTPARATHDISNLTETLEVQLPRYHSPDRIVHDVSVEWALRRSESDIERSKQ